MNAVKLFICLHHVCSLRNGVPISLKHMPGAFPLTVEALQQPVSDRFISGNHMLFFNIEWHTCDTHLH